MWNEYGWEWSKPSIEWLSSVDECVRSGWFKLLSVTEARIAHRAIELNTDRSQWLTVVSSDADGLCVNNAQRRVPVLFGINSRSGCFITYVLRVLSSRLVAWLNGRTSVFGRRTFPVLRSTCSWRVTTYVGKPSAIGQPTRPTQPFIPLGSIDEY